MRDEIYTNKIDWKVGDLVIHAGDMKKRDMLMVVVKKQNKNGAMIYWTRYLDPESVATIGSKDLIWKYVCWSNVPAPTKRHYERIFKNVTKDLLNPADFLLDTKDLRFHKYLLRPKEGQSNGKN